MLGKVEVLALREALVGKDQDREIETRVQQPELCLHQLASAILHLQLGFDDVGVRDLWARTHGASVTIAVVDAGVDATVPDIADKLIAPEIDLTDAHDGASDHGTAVAALAAGSVDNGVASGGIAWDSRLLSIKVLDRSFDYGAAMHILMKDIDLAISQGEELGVPMWVCQAARLVFKHAMFERAANDDLSTLVRHIERGAGFELPTRG